MARLNISFIKELQNAPFEKEKYFGDDTLKGFGLRWQRSSMSYVFKYRNAYGQQKTYNIGNINKLTPDEARKLAKDLFSDVAKGNDPCKEKQSKKKELTIAELCDWYMKEGTSHKKASTLQVDQGRIERHIKPLIGKEPITGITRGQIEKFMFDIVSGEKIQKKEKSDKPRGQIIVKGGKTAAARTVGLLGAIFEFAKNHNLIITNPAHGIKKPKDNTKEVFLTIDEIKLLGSILNSPERQALQKPALDSIKLLLLTGCRKNEVLSLKWEYIDFENQCFRFPDTKTGKQTRPFGLGALHLLREIQQKNYKSQWVFPATLGDGHYVGLPRVFKSIAEALNSDGERIIKKDITIHTLRHTFASVGAEMGYSEFTLAGLLGHRLRGVTNRYSHIVDKSLIQTADSISLRIENAMEGNESTTAKIINISRGA